MPKVSVIVPVYNVEAYLEKCVSSVLAQTCPDFELLLIDDGSTDGSGRLCDLLAQSDSRIRVIHQENQGLGGARNTGIQAAQGDWLLPVDSDDWIEPDILEKALAAADKTGAELVIFGFRSVYEDGNVQREYRHTLPTEEALTTAARPDLLLAYPVAWNKLYRRDLFLRTQVLYPPRVWYEDIRTTPKLMTQAKAVTVIPDIGYNYLQRSGSIMNNRNLSRNREILDAFDDLLAWFESHGLLETYRRELEYLCLYHGYLTASVRVLRQSKDSPLLEEFASYLRRHFPAYRESPYLSRLTRNERILLPLVENRHYTAIRLLFKLKR